MASRHLVLAVLEQHKGSYVSGQEIAQRLDITRAAVWRAIAELRKQGYDIEASTKIGYRLAADSDKLSSEGIMSVLPEGLAVDIRYHETIDSTNREAKRLALEGCVHGTVVVSGSQSGGRGRLGRSFYSPPDSGLYLSVVLRPDVASSFALRITSAAAVAVCRAIERHSDRKASIKWVNDIFMDGRKVCGILTEGVSGFESGRIESVVVGIGLNHTEPNGGFPDELTNIAGAVFSSDSTQKISRNQLAADILSCLFELLPQLSDDAFIEEYRQRSIVLGKTVRVMQGNVSYEAVATGITDDGSLVVKTPEGDENILGTGEISIRW